MIKKLAYYLPAIIFFLFIGFIRMLTPLYFGPIAYVWVALLIVSGALLSSGRFWGGIFGMIPGMHMIYMSTQNTGQTINIERPAGIVILIYYLLCSGLVFYRLNMQEKGTSAK